LTPLYAKVGSVDELARLVSAPRSSLSAVNSGKRNLGLVLARRLRDATGVSLVDLGAPEEVVAGDPPSRPVLDRLKALEATVAALQTEREEILQGVVERLALLEAAVQTAGRRPARRSSEGSAR
jgi:hypothetical protein